MKNSALDFLRNEIPNNVPLYNSQDKWIDKYFEDKGIENYSFSTGITVPDIELTIGGSETDYENAVKVYNVFKDRLTSVQASDLRLWAYLAHSVYWKYMRRRWAINLQSDDDNEDAGNKLVSRIGARYFFNTSKGKAFVRQGIARLYWSAYLTYNEKNKDNPYELTEYFLSKQDIFTVSAERSLARDKTLFLSALKILKKHGDLTRSQIRRYFLALNQAGGVIVFDSLSSDASYDLAKKTLYTVLNETEDHASKDKKDGETYTKNVSEKVSDTEEAKVTSSITSELPLKRVKYNSKLIISNIRSGVRIPMAVNRTSFQTQPDLVGLSVGDKFKIRKEIWKIDKIK